MEGAAGAYFLAISQRASDVCESAGHHRLQSSMGANDSARWRWWLWHPQTALVGYDAAQSTPPPLHSYSDRARIRWARALLHP